MDVKLKKRGIKTACKTVKSNMAQNIKPSALVNCLLDNTKVLVRQQTTVLLHPLWNMSARVFHSKPPKSRS